MSDTFKDQVRRVSILEAREQLSATHLFCIGYAWLDKTFGELTGSTVVDACDEETALRRFKTQNRQVHRSWIINEEVGA